MPSLLSEQITSLYNNINRIKLFFDSETLSNGDLLSNYKILFLDYVRDQIFEFNSTNSANLSLVNSAIDSPKLNAELETVIDRTNILLYHSKTLNPKIEVTIPGNFIPRDTQGTLVEIKDETNKVEIDLNRLNNRMSSVNLTKFSEDYDLFIKTFNFDYWNEKSTANSTKLILFSELLQKTDSLYNLVDLTLIELDAILIKLINLLYPDKNIIPPDILSLIANLLPDPNTYPSFPPNLRPNLNPKLYGVLSNLSYTRDEIFSNKTSVFELKANLLSVFDNFKKFNDNLKNLIKFYSELTEDTKANVKSKIIALSKTKDSISSLKSDVNHIKTSSPLVHGLENLTIDPEFKTRFINLRNECIRVYYVFEEQAIILSNRFIIDNKISITDIENPHHAIFGSEYFGGMYNIFKLVEDENDVYSIKRLYTNMNFEKFYSLLLYYLEMNKKFQIDADQNKLQELYIAIKRLIITYTYTLRVEFSKFINESQYNFYNNNANLDELLVKTDSHKNDMELVFYTLNSAAPKGISNSKLDYDGSIVKLDDDIIKDIKFVSFKTKVGKKYNFNVMLKNIVFGLENNKSDKIELDISITISMKNELLPSRSYISPSYTGASIVFGFGKIDEAGDISSFFISTENIAEIKLNNIVVGGAYDYNNLYLFMDHVFHENNPFGLNKTLIKVEENSHTQKTCLYNSKPINGLYEFGLLELTTLAHDSKYSEMTLEELVLSGVKNLTLSNIYYYINGLPENGFSPNDEIDPDFNKNEVKTKYLLEFSNFLTPIVTNWINSELYVFTPEQIKNIVYDFCSVYLNSVFDTLTGTTVQYEEVIAYNSEFILESRLENQIYHNVTSFTPSIVDQIYNNEHIDLVKIEFRSVCNNFVSTVYEVIPVSDKEKKARDEMIRLYDILKTDCIEIYRLLITEQLKYNDDIYQILLNGPFNICFESNIKPLIIRFSNYGINEQTLQQRINDIIIELIANMKRYLKLLDIEILSKTIRDFEKFNELYRLINSSILIIIRQRV